MSYIIITMISAVLLGLYDFFKKVSVKRDDNIYQILFLFTFVAFLCNLFFFNDAISISFKYIMLLLLKAFIISVNWFLTIKAMSKLELGITVPFSMLGSVSTTILASIIFKERIGEVQVLGILLILFGLFLISRLGEKKENIENEYKYIWLLIIGAVLSSFSAIIDKYLSLNISYKTISFWFFFFLSLIYFIVLMFVKRRIDFKGLKKNFYYIFLTGLCIFLADIVYYSALGVENSNVSIISIVRKLSVFIGVMLGSLFLKEKNFVKKLSVLIMMFGGITLILIL